MSDEEIDLGRTLFDYLKSRLSELDIRGAVITVKVIATAAQFVIDQLPEKVDQAANDVAASQLTKIILDFLQASMHDPVFTAMAERLSVTDP